MNARTGRLMRRVYNDKFNMEDIQKETYPHAFSPVFFLRTLWLLTYSDLTTFVMPQTLFGYFGALSALAPTTNATPSALGITLRLPHIILWTWLNTLIFNVANQRHEASILEDRINKPWRPIAAGRLSTTQARHLLVSGMAVVLMVTRFLGGFQETALLFALNWVYNDLGASDENIFVRNLTIAIAFMLYGLGALKVACGASHCTTTPQTYTWLYITGIIILSTIHIQDLKDVDGDRARNRMTFPLVGGQETSRWSIAVSVLCWSTICPWFWNVPGLAYGVVIASGSIVSWRVIVHRNFEGDQMTWKLWACWLIICYILPSVNLVYYSENFEDLSILVILPLKGSNGRNWIPRPLRRRDTHYQD